MDTALFAKVLTAKKDGKRTIGTGYPIGKDLVLTARHVVVFPERNECKPILIEWPDQKGNGGASFQSEATEIVFDGGETCDIAVLKCDVPRQAQLSQPTLAQRIPSAHETWESFGFPQIGKDNKTGEREKISALGKFHPPDSTTHKISLTSESDALENAGWCGISGAPVFQNKTLYAVITQTPTRRDECFSAVSIPWLLSHDPKFCLAVGMDTDSHQKFITKQKRQIRERLCAIDKDRLYQALVEKLKLPRDPTPDELSEKLFDYYDANFLVLFDMLLQASAEALKRDAGSVMLENVQILFCLFAGLLAPKSSAAKQAVIKLSVYTRMATEIYLAPLYDTNPNFIFEDGEAKGKYGIDASVFTRETGWETKEFLDEAFLIVSKGVRKDSSVKSRNAFETTKLNTFIKQRQNRELNQLHRLELNRGDGELANNPLHDPKFCEALNAPDCLPDLPIVHYGTEAADMEAELSAKIEEFFVILDKYG